jgi:DNA-directed RNA polymerase subunit RPC12/RpoP
MFVACPHCGFLVAAQAGTALRCPRCGSPIDPKLAKPLPAPQPAPVESNAEPVVAAEPVPEASAEATVEAVADPAPAPASEAAAPRRKRSSHAPSFARRHAPAPIRVAQWRSWLVVAGLGVLLLTQAALAQREELAANARWRPLISGMCTVLRCEIPTWREPTAFTMLQRSVQPKIGTRGVLHVSASFRNDARWAQPWPTVLLTLSDMDGRQVGLRAFTPAEYRGQGDAGHIAPGQSATIQLDVVEPAQQVVAFTFDFL